MYGHVVQPLTPVDNVRQDYSIVLRENTRKKATILAQSAHRNTHAEHAPCAQRARTVGPSSPF